MLYFNGFEIDCGNIFFFRSFLGFEIIIIYFTFIYDINNYIRRVLTIKDKNYQNLFPIICEA